MPLDCPDSPEGHSVVCGYDQGFGERIIVCNTLVGMQQLYDAFAGGGAVSIQWYSGEDVGFIQTV